MLSPWPLSPLENVRFSDKFQGVREPEHISPDAWTLDQWGLDRPGNVDIQLALFQDYRTNPERYAEWQEYFRRSQPPLLAVWGKHDSIFCPVRAEAFKHDVPDSEDPLLETGHFGLEEDGAVIAELSIRFLTTHLPA